MRVIQNEGVFNGDLKTTLTFLFVLKSSMNTLKLTKKFSSEKTGSISQILEHFRNDRINLRYICPFRND
jgi:hypothetical protein